MPFGLYNAPAMFWKLVHNVFGKNLDESVIFHKDDILVFNRTMGEHIQHFRWTLAQFRAHKHKAKH